MFDVFCDSPINAQNEKFLYASSYTIQNKNGDSFLQDSHLGDF